jgi:predicted transcriptional regulator
MTPRHDQPKPAKRVAEPVQVYLDTDQRSRLERLAAQLDTTKSGVLRQALEALERELTDPAAHPALQLIGLAHDDRSAGGAVTIDPARDHDTVLADTEQDAWDDLSGAAGG